MINLTPPEGKRLVRREYLLRALSVWMILLAIVCGAFALMLVPTYVLLVARADALATAYAELATDDQDAYRVARDQVNEANTLASQLNIQPEGVLVSGALAEVYEALIPEVSLRSFLYTRDGARTLSLQVAGTAASRESLVQFRDALERSPIFSDVTVPVSSLARDADIPFTITVTIADETN